MVAEQNIATLSRYQFTRLMAPDPHACNSFRSEYPKLGASRPVVDSGWLPKERQVGKSGMTVKPKLYVAVGISGAPEHLDGMHAASLIIAINADPNAPIFQVASYGTTCDLFDLLPALTELLKAAG